MCFSFTKHCHLHRRSCRPPPCRPPSYLSMTRVPAFNILDLGLKTTTHRLTQGLLVPLSKGLYTASMSLQTFLFLSAVSPIYFTDLLSSPLTLSSFSGSEVLVYGTTITTNASGSQDPTWECFIDNTSIGWSPAPPMSVNNWILCGGGPGQFQVAHRESKRFESANFLVRSDSICSICQRLTKSIAIAYRFIRCSNSL